MQNLGVLFSKYRRAIFIVSILLNVIFAILFLLIFTNSPTHRYGVLTHDVNVGFLASDSTIYTIPKGITVCDASEQGLAAIGQFENNRFEIIITTDRSDFVDYNAPRKTLFEFGNMYSADAVPGTAR